MKTSSLEATDLDSALVFSLSIDSMKDKQRRLLVFRAWGLSSRQ
jgi:hypothetical protein